MTAKRILSLIMVLCLVFTMMPMTAFAAETTKVAVYLNKPDGEMVKFWMATVPADANELPEDKVEVVEKYYSDNAETLAAYELPAGPYAIEDGMVTITLVEKSEEPETTKVGVVVKTPDGETVFATMIDQPVDATELNDEAIAKIEEKLAAKEDMDAYELPAGPYVINVNNVEITLVEKSEEPETTKVGVVLKDAEGNTLNYWLVSVPVNATVLPEEAVAKVKAYYEEDEALVAKYNWPEGPFAIEAETVITLEAKPEEPKTTNIGVVLKDAEGNTLNSWLVSVPVNATVLPDEVVAKVKAYYEADEALVAAYNWPEGPFAIEAETVITLEAKPAETTKIGVVLKDAEGNSLANILVSVPVDATVLPDEVVESIKAKYYDEELAAKYNWPEGPFAIEAETVITLVKKSVEATPVTPVSPVFYGYWRSIVKNIFASIPRYL